MSAGADPELVRHPGLVTRAIAFVVDAAVINCVSMIVAAGVTLGISLFHLPHNVRLVLGMVGAGAYVLWTLAYFLACWSATGQTPGSRLMQIRVISTDGDRVGWRRGLVRCVGLVLAALPLLSGYLLILFDPRRRGLHDRIAGTLVIEAPQLSFAAGRRARRQEPGRRGTPGAGARRSSVSGDDRGPARPHPVHGRG